MMSSDIYTLDFFNTDAKNEDVRAHVFSKVAILGPKKR